MSRRRVWPRLTAEEREICELSVRGYNHVRIAQQLGLSVLTVKHRFSRLYLKLGLLDRTKYHRHIQLAVMLTYERRPDLKPHPGLQAIDSCDEDGFSPSATGTRKQVRNRGPFIFYNQPTCGASGDNTTPTLSTEMRAGGAD